MIHYWLGELVGIILSYPNEIASVLANDRHYVAKSKAVQAIRVRRKFILGLLAEEKIPISDHAGGEVEVG
jgi:hypothetical protein